MFLFTNNGVFNLENSVPSVSQEKRAILVNLSANIVALFYNVHQDSRNACQKKLLQWN